ncbi:lipopolysaccharide-induced tumor necrosis factor-alpha factor homolog [Centruroides sculpturatus]|uniref:lipopolysaccharide-induced tumor necrosis factor-alpha factor homolog n=1 Tax=Centruroides sculpturatus TaxID=218467 RepID=UPI000C6DF183|nr:lipopolysaccharide-induced tumor necrosis factor-alpha factor homolog [Centruroides sculpturatus]
MKKRFNITVDISKNKIKVDEKNGQEVFKMEKNMDNYYNGNMAQPTYPPPYPSMSPPVGLFQAPPPFPTQAAPPAPPQAAFQNPTELTIEKNTIILMQQNKLNVGKYPVKFTCPNCKREGTTFVQMENGRFAYLATFVTCLVFLPLFFVPLCIDATKDIIHTCPFCHAIVGVKKRI